MDKIFLTVFISAILIGCNASNKQTVETGAPSRPDTLVTELMVEGMAESMKMYLLEAPQEFPIHFSTYVPIEMRTDTMLGKNGDAIHIFAAFGGQLNKDARLTIYAFQTGLSEEEARKLTREKARKLGAVPADSAQFAWAEMVYNLKGSRSGFLGLAKEKGSWFYLLATYPPEYADGMGPRIAMILDKWRWTDSGELLR